jgi:polysaccharide chain length determinant protein (PEP-CTERM system associated)
MTSPLATARAAYREFAPELRARRWLIIGTIWAIAALGTAVTALLPDQYATKARVYVDTDSLLKPLLQGLTVQPDIQRQIEMMRQTLLSRPNLEQLIRMTDMDLALDSPAAWDRAVVGLEKDIKILPESRQLFTISYANRDPDQTERVVSSLLKIFVEQNLGSNRRDIEKSQKFINEQIAEYEARLREIEAKVAAFRQTHAEELLDRDTVGKALEAAEADLRQAQTEMEEAIWTRGQINLELTRTPATVAPGLQARTADGKTVQEDLESQLAALRLRYTEAHPDVIELRRRIEAAKSAPGGQGAPGVPNPLRAELERGLRQSELRIEQLRQRVSATQQRIADLKVRLADSPAIDLERAQLDRDYAVLQDNYKQLIARRESARLAQQVDDNTQSVDFRVVEPPVRPVLPSAPNRVLLMLGVIVAALAGGIGAGVLAVKLRDTFANAADLRRRFDIDVIGTVSVLGRPAGAVTLRTARLEIASVAALLLLFGGAVTIFAAPGLLSPGGAKAAAAPRTP